MAIYTSLNAANKCAGPFAPVPDTDSSIGCSDESCGPSFHHAAITTQLNANTTYFVGGFIPDVLVEVELDAIVAQTI